MHPVMVQVSDIEAELVTPSAKVRYVGTTSPRGIWHVGGYGLGITDDGVNFSGTNCVQNWWFMHHEHEDHFLPAVNLPAAYYNCLYWRFLPGVEVEITVFW